MNTIWALVLITATQSGIFTVELKDTFNYKPSCQIAAEGRQLFLTAEYIDHKKYTCVALHPEKNK